MKATLVIYQTDGSEPTVVEFNVVDEGDSATIVITPEDVQINTPKRPTIIPVASCPVHFASALDVHAGDDPESWEFTCRTEGETYTYAELMKDKS